MSKWSRPDLVDDWYTYGNYCGNSSARCAVINGEEVVTVMSWRKQLPVEQQGVLQLADLNKVSYQISLGDGSYIYEPRYLHNVSGYGPLNTLVRKINQPDDFADFWAEDFQVGD